MDKSIPLYKCNYTINKALLDLLCSISYKSGKLTSLNLAYPKGKLDASETSYLLLLIDKEISQSKIRALSRGEKINNPVEGDCIYKLLTHINNFDATNLEAKKYFETNYFLNGVPCRTSKTIEDFEFELPPASKINALIKRLHKFFESNDGDSSNLIFSALSFFEIISIAPYTRENIVLAYLYSRSFLGKYSPILRQIPLAKYLFKRKESMNDALLKSDSKGDCVHFFLFFFKIVDDCLDELMKNGVKNATTLSPKVIKMLDKMEKGKFYSSFELLTLLNLKSRLGLHKNYIKPALEANLLLMSNPLSPTDRTQRYMRKEK